MKRKRIPEELYRQVEPELLAGETLLWAARPKNMFAAFGRSKYMMKIGVSLGTFMLMVLGLVAFSYFEGGSSSWAMIVPIVATLLAVIATVGVLAVPLLSNRNALYAVTDRRALILKDKSVQSYGPEDLRFIERRMQNDTTGDIIFDRRIENRPNNRSPYEVPVGFMGIEHAREVEALMLETFRPDDDDNFYAKSKRENRLQDYAYEDDDALEQFQ